MSSTASVLGPATRARVRLLTFPREHGAWGILLVPLVAGAVVGSSSLSAIIPTILFAIAAVALFCLRTPLESLAGASAVRPQNAAERHAVVFSIAAYGGVAAGALAILLWNQRAWDLPLLGTAVAVIFLAQALLKTIRRELRPAAQLLGSLGLTSTAAAAYYVAADHMDATAYSIWAANWLFAANQIHFVQLRIHAPRAASRSERLERGRAFLIAEALLFLILIFAWKFHWIPALAPLAFAPVLVRGLAWALSSRAAPLEVHQLGKSELAHSILFGVLLILSFRIAL
ncbi:MAG TPA: YwiC-like family protein [Terriglobia bacterium]|nr:YwiC-like family protein [Terriglobia bacterium]